MVNVTLSVPMELKHKMDEFGVINWSGVAREAFMQKIADLEFLREFKSRSEMTPEDAIRLGSRVNESLARRYGIKGV